MGGYEAKRKTELWPGSPDNQCDDLKDYPIESLFAVAFNTAEGPAVCGGPRENRCFIYKQHQWLPFTNMTTERKFASATEVNNDQALIIGGRDENWNDFNTTEFISTSGAEKGNDFLVPVWGHCSFKINATHALVTGGEQDGSASTSTWLVDLTTTTFTKGPNMKTRRYYHGCSIFHLGTKSYGIVTGGDYAMNSTETIDLDQESPKWTEGMQDK